MTFDSLLMKCLLKHRMIRGREAERTLRYTVQRRVNSTHRSTVTLQQTGGRRRRRGEGREMSEGLKAKVIWLFLTRGKLPKTSTELFCDTRMR